MPIFYMYELPSLNCYNSELRRAGLEPSLAQRREALSACRQRAGSPSCHHQNM